MSGGSRNRSGDGRAVPGPPFLPVSELLHLLDAPERERPLLVDARAQKQYRLEHLPGAVSLPARELNPVEAGVRRLVDPHELRERLVPLADRQLVLYGARGGADAAHLWWTLRAFGHERLWLLDGGIEAWQRGGGALVSGPEPALAPAPPPLGSGTGDRPAKAHPRAGEADSERLVTAQELLERLDDPDLAIVDTREPEEYRGEMKAAKRGGHIPGAVLFPWTSALGNELRLHSEAKLRELLAPILEKPEAVVYCQSGVRAAHTAAVLEMLRHPRPRLYLGSWGEWGNRDELPIAGMEEEGHVDPAA